MKTYNKLENTIEYDVIEYDVKPSIDELTEALDIIHNSKYCKVIFWFEYEPKYHQRFIYYKNGKVHNDFGLAMNDFFAINGDLVQQCGEYNSILKFRKEIRKFKLDEIKIND